MSKRQAQDDGMPSGLVLFWGVCGGITLSIVWCGLTGHFDRLQEMEDDIMSTETRVFYLEDFKREVEGKYKVTIYTCDEMKGLLEGMKNSGDEWSLNHIIVKGKCK